MYPPEFKFNCDNFEIASSTQFRLTLALVTNKPPEFELSGTQNPPKMGQMEEI